MVRFSFLDAKVPEDTKTEQVRDLVMASIDKLTRQPNFVRSHISKLPYMLWRERKGLARKEELKWEALKQINKTY